MIQMEGTGSLFKGVLAPVMGLAGLNAILFVSYGGILRYLQQYPGNLINHEQYQPSLGQVYLAGCGAGMACFLFSTPTDLIKIQAQVSQLNKTTWQVMKEIFYRNGLTGFYQGGWITLIRDCPSYGIYFWVYEGMKRSLMDQSGNNEDWKLLLAGGMAGTISWASIYPIDVIKSRLQMQVITANTVESLAVVNETTALSSLSGGAMIQQQPYYTSIRDCIVRSYQAEGVGVFFRGLTPTLLRGFPVNAVTFWVYEIVMNWLS
ncbi:mitochondrial carrier domain-containing protein [Halteromyces radiatus]|uniref:mitochondrial carrier domain-containing protein n=1 Tax=Halteromyces radiatus TaxID=101107 RepID=UPI00221F7EA1|nr:mitochondrial carrier domain-containing protein [Halteromyces radiatus]KAI8096322.1 mitochondrial carrier domain-containing protein [Halteromyces radiatus]